jgi:hypothetical protein
VGGNPSEGDCGLPIVCVTLADEFPGPLVPAEGRLIGSAVGDQFGSTPSNGINGVRFGSRSTQWIIEKHYDE